MTRLQRKYSNTGCYHIMLRGNEKKNIFLDDEDRQKFINVMDKKNSQAELSLYAYCLMSNHVHLVLKDRTNELSLIMKGIATSYAMYFNKKYCRVGHVFQDRFKSETVEDERYLMAVIRYVHRNPLKAKLVESPEGYKWSSYWCYMNPDEPAANLVDTQYILNTIAVNPKSAVREFNRFVMENNDDKFLDMDEGGIRTLEDAELYLNNYLQKNWPEFSRKEIRTNRSLRNEIIAVLRKNTELPIVGIAKLLAVNRGVVERVRPEYY
ncbi:transposase [Desulfosporosinus hippei]|nr:transposase [Desulfosporosinus hippei]